MDPYFVFLFAVAVVIVGTIVLLQERRRRKAPRESRAGWTEVLLGAVFMFLLAATEAARLLIEGTLSSIPLILIGLVGGIAISYLYWLKTKSGSRS